MQGLLPFSLVPLAVLLVLFLLLRRRPGGAWVERAAADRRIRWPLTALGVLALCVLLGLALPVSRFFLLQTGLEPLSTGLFAGLVALLCLPLAWRALLLRGTGQPLAAQPFLRAHGWQIALLAALSLVYLWLGGAAQQALRTLGEAAGDGWLHSGARMAGNAMLLLSFAATLTLLMTVVPTLRWLARRMTALRARP